MGIDAFLQSDVVVIDADSPARDAARAMRERQVGSVVVVSGSADAGPRRLEGVVTDRDLAMAVVAGGADAGTRIGEFAHRPVISIPRGAGVGQAAAIMRSAAVRRLVVVDDHQAMVGIIALDDLLAGAADLLRDLSEATSWARDRERRTLRDGEADAAAVDPITVPAALGRAWRHIVQP